MTNKTTKKVQETKAVVPSKGTTTKAKPSPKPDRKVLTSTPQVNEAPSADTKVATARLERRREARKARRAKRREARIERAQAVVKGISAKKLAALAWACRTLGVRGVEVK